MDHTGRTSTLCLDIPSALVPFVSSRQRPKVLDYLIDLGALFLIPEELPYRIVERVRPLLSADVGSSVGNPEATVRSPLYLLSLDGYTELGVAYCRSIQVDVHSAVSPDNLQEAVSSQQSYQPRILATGSHGRSRAQGLPLGPEDEWACDMLPGERRDGWPAMVGPT